MDDNNRNIAFGNLGVSSEGTKETTPVTPVATSSIPFVPSQSDNTPTVVPSQNMEVTTAFELEGEKEEVVEETIEEVPVENREAHMSFFEPTESSSVASTPTSESENKDFFKKVKTEEVNNIKTDNKFQKPKKKEKVKFNIGPLFVVIIFIAALYGVFYYLINNVKPPVDDTDVEYAEQYDPKATTTSVEATTDNRPNGLPQ